MTIIYAYLMQEAAAYLQDVFRGNEARALDPAER